MSVGPLEGLIAGNQYRIVVLIASSNAGVADDEADTANGDATTESVQADAETDTPAVNGLDAPLTYEEILARITEAMAEDALAMWRFEAICRGFGGV
jgi:hypothetical protein